jgi:AcrR family transcriptional regulator
MKPRDRLMRVADELFYARGLRAVGIDEIIAKSGVAKATLYAHFPTKDDLIAAYLQRRSDAWREHVEAALAAHAAHPIRRIDATFTVLAEGCQAAGFRGCPFIRAAAEYPDPAHPARQVVATYRRWVRALFRAAATQGMLRHADALADQLTLLYDSALVGSQLAGDATPAARAREAARTLVAAASPRRAARGRATRRT